MAMTYPMSLLLSGDVFGAILWVMSSYITFGILWVYLAILIFYVIQTKTESYAISGVVVMFFVSMIGFLLPVEIQPYFNLLLGVLATALLLRVLKE